MRTCWFLHVSVFTAGGNLPPIPGVVFVVLLAVIALVLFIIERYKSVWVSLQQLKVAVLNLRFITHLNRAFPAVSYMIKHTWEKNLNSIVTAVKTSLHQIIFHTQILQIHSNTQHTSFQLRKLHFLSLWVCLTADSDCLFFKHIMILLNMFTAYYE